MSEEGHLDEIRFQFQNSTSHSFWEEVPLDVNFWTSPNMETWMSKFQKARILMMIVKQGQGIISAHARFITSFLCFPFFNIFVSLNLSLLFCYYILFIIFYPYCCHSLQPISALTKQKSEVTLPIL